MKTVLLRRRKLGKTSCREIKKFMKHPITVICHGIKDIPTDTEQIIRWGCTATVPAKMVINKAAAIHQVADKLEFRKTLNEEKLCPATWFNFDDIPATAKWPMVVRPSHHAQGRNLYMAKSIEELDRIYDTHPKLHRGFYISEFIDKVAEYRIAIMCGRVVWIAEKTPANKDEVAWNVAKGGRFDNVRWNNWPLKAAKIAIAAFDLSDLDFGGVDVMVDKEGGVTVLEINSAPSLTSPYRQECTAKAFDYTLKYGKDRIGLTDKKGKYLKFIHPAIDKQALTC